MSAVDDALDDLLALARVPAPTFDEGERIEWLLRRLEGAPGRRGADAAGSLIWRFDDGAPARAAARARGHRVRARAARTSLCSRARGLRGPGVGDNAAAVVCAVQVVEQMARERSLEGLAVAFTVGEEGLGNLAGARAACAELKPQLALALEGHGLLHVAVDAVGSLRARISVDGPGGHSWANRGRPSAIDEVCRIARGAQPSPEARGEHEHRAHRGRHGRQRDRGARRARDRAARARRGRARALRARAAAAGGRAAADASRSRCWAAARPAASTGVSRCSRPCAACASGSGLPDELVAASTDANAALAAGIPALCLGCAQGGEMHTPDEFIEIASLAAGREQLRGVLAELLWENPRP